MRRGISRRQLLYGLGALGFLALTSCSHQNSQKPSAKEAGTVVQMYRSPACGCCKEYGKYLEDKGLVVQHIVTEEMDKIKEDLGVPKSMESCHTLKISRYFVEGHVPVEAIQKLLAEQPDIDGIALPGMPSGSPGMGGTKKEPFVIYAISKGRTSEFMRL